MICLSHGLNRHNSKTEFLSATCSSLACDKKPSQPQGDGNNETKRSIKELVETDAAHSRLCFPRCAFASLSRVSQWRCLCRLCRSEAAPAETRSKATQRVTHPRCERGSGSETQNSETHPQKSWRTQNCSKRSTRIGLEKEPGV